MFSKKAMVRKNFHKFSHLTRTTLRGFPNKLSMKVRVMFGIGSSNFEKSNLFDDLDNIFVFQLMFLSFQNATCEYADIKAVINNTY